jgi:putative ABC transport system permease protein
LLARGTVRRREIAVRIALGAGRARIVRQLLTETGLLAAGGGLLGLLIVWIGIHGLAALTPPIAGAHLRAPRIGVETVSLIAAFVAVAGLLCGLAQALVAAKPSPVASVRDPGPVVVAARGNTLRTLLVTTQVALALMLLVGLGLLTNSYLRLTYRELNFDATGLLTFEVRTDAPQRSLGRIDGYDYYELLTVPSQTMTRIYERLTALPQVSSVAGISFPPVDSLILPVMNVRAGRSLER